MKILDLPLLKSFRLSRRCEWCGVCGPVEAHHVFGRGMAGSWRLDVRLNLVALCRGCHDAYHLGHILRQELLRLVATRENTTPEAIETEVYRLRRTP